MAAWHPSSNVARAARPCLLFFFLLPVSLQAAPDITSPLAGYYRPGKYMPLRVAATDQATLSLSAPDAVETRIDRPRNAIVPFLPIESLRDLRWTTPAGSGTVGIGWKSLSAEERLVGFAATVSPAMIQKLFPDKTILPIRLDPQDPVPGPPAAWEALDALVLDAASLDGRKLPDLLAAGIVIIVRTPTRPDTTWPWRPVEDCWVLSPDLRGPRITTDHTGAFAPVQGWRAEWPAAFRLRVALYAVGFAILAMAGALLGRQRGPLVVLLISAITVAGLALWWRGRGAVLERTASVVVLGDITQADDWSYRATPSPAADRIAFAGHCRPLFEVPQQAELIKLALICDENGTPQSFEYQALPGLTVAFLSRSLHPARPSPAAPAPALQALERLAKRAYLRRGDRIVGMDGQALVIERGGGM